MKDIPSPVVPAISPARSRPVYTILAVVIVILCAILALIGYFQAVLMGVIQGLTEPLPVSSSAHLYLVPWMLGWSGGLVSSLTFDVALHLGTLVAFVIYFWRDWVRMLSHLPELVSWALRRGAGALSLDARALGAIILGTIPAAIAGVLLENWAETAFRNPLLVATTLAIMGVILYVVDRFVAQVHSLNDLTWGRALLIGLAQAAALVPGVSRSGSTITMARLLSFDRPTAARFSFLLSMPITAAALMLKFPAIVDGARHETGLFVVGVLVSGAVGLLAIHFLLDYVRRAGFGIFAAYRIALAALVLVVYGMRG